jgi:NAD(P)-dependent dehydrogenase (short-subunit alcohol dehydrogenase family)
MYTFRKRTRRNERRLDVNFLERKTIQEKENNMNITNKAVLITGANRGIGRALVNEALRRGAKGVYAGTRGAFQHADKRVTQLTLDVTSASQIQRAAAEVDSLDVLINNADIYLYDDLGNSDIIEQHLAVNLFGSLKVTRAFLPLLRRSKGAIVNNLSLTALAPVPVTPAYSISKAAAFNMTQSLRALLAGEGVTVHAVLLGPVDTDMTRGLEIPKAAPELVARGIFDGLEKKEEDIFPDPVSQSMAEGWWTGVAKAFERQYAGFVPERSAWAAVAE